VTSSLLQSSVETFCLRNLQDGCTYLVRVTATDGRGIQSPQSFCAVGQPCAVTPRLSEPSACTICDSFGSSGSFGALPPLDADVLPDTSGITPCEGPLWLDVLQSSDQFSTFYTLLTSIDPYGITGKASACEFLNGSDLGAEKDCNIYNIVNEDIVYFNQSTVLAPTNDAFDIAFDALGITLDDVITGASTDNVTGLLRYEIAALLSNHFLKDVALNSSDISSIASEDFSSLLPTSLQLALSPQPISQPGGGLASYLDEVGVGFEQFTSLGLTEDSEGNPVFVPFNNSAFSASPIADLSDTFACQFPSTGDNVSPLFVYIHGIDSVLLPYLEAGDIPE